MINQNSSVFWFRDFCYTVVKISKLLSSAFQFHSSSSKLKPLLPSQIIYAAILASCSCFTTFYKTQVIYERDTIVMLNSRKRPSLRWCVTIDCNDN